MIARLVNGPYDGAVGELPDRFAVPLLWISEGGTGPNGLVLSLLRKGASCVPYERTASDPLIYKLEGSEWSPTEARQDETATA